MYFFYIKLFLIGNLFISIYNIPLFPQSLNSQVSFFSLKEFFIFTEIMARWSSWTEEKFINNRENTTPSSSKKNYNHL